MRFINKELLTQEKLSVSENEIADLKVKYPSVGVGAGLDGNSLLSGVLCGKMGSVWGVSISYFSGGKWMDGEKVSLKSLIFGCNFNDGKYSYIKTDKIVTDFVCYDKNILVVRIASKRKVKVRIKAYTLSEAEGKFQFDDQTIRGISGAVGVNEGEVFFERGKTGYKNRYAVIDEKNKEYFYMGGYEKPFRWFIDKDKNAVMEAYSSQNLPFIMYMCVSDKDFEEFKLPPMRDVEEKINDIQLEYFSQKCNGSGLGAKAETLANLCMWNKVYFPFYGQQMYVSDRYNVGKDYCFDPSADSLALIVNSHVLNDDILKQAMQLAKNGNFVPLFVLFSLYKHGKLKAENVTYFKKLKEVYPPSNDIVQIDNRDMSITDTLIQGFSDKKTSNTKMYSLHHTCLKSCEMELMQNLAEFFNDESAKAYEEAYLAIRNSINDKFYDRERKAYFNIQEDGTFSKILGINSFFPLLAGAVDDTEKLGSMVRALKDTTLFGSDKVLKYISKNSLIQARRNLKKRKQDTKLTYNMPTITMPYANYLIYLGLLRYGCNEEAHSLATSCSKMFDNIYKSKRESILNYRFMRFWRYSKEVKTPNLSEALLSLAGLQCMLNVEYFSKQNGAIMFGTFAKGDNSVSNIKIHGKNYSIFIKDLVTILMENDVIIFKGEGGKFVIRHFVSNSSGVSFKVIAKANIKISLNCMINKTKCSFIVKSGESDITVVNNQVTIQ